MKRTVSLTIGLSLLATLLLLTGVGLVYAQSGSILELVSWTIDVGGDTPITGGDYELLSTVGQPDAAPDVGGGVYIIQSGFWPSMVRPTGVYLPLVIKGPAPSLPDLVGDFSLTPDKASYNAGEPVLISVEVSNVGDGPAGPFWVDFYINPSEVPAVNRRWNDICGMSPCYGLAWYVSGGLAPGQSVTLTSDDAAADYSVWPGYFAGGTSDLYLYVDSWNPSVADGGVAERNEGNNLAERHGLSVTGVSTVQGDYVTPAELPPRPAP
jgi:hypothetical protein